MKTEIRDRRNMHEVNMNKKEKGRIDLSLRDDEMKTLNPNTELINIHIGANLAIEAKWHLRAIFHDGTNKLVAEIHWKQMGYYNPLTAYSYSH